MSELLTVLVDSDAPLALEAMERFSLDVDRQESLKPKSLIARGLLRKMLSEKTATAPARWTFRRGENGKPEARFDGAFSPLAISISHSGPYVACAIAEAEALGIDIEVHQDWRDLKNIADLAFGPEEQRLVARDGADAFYRIWTLREALAKATGQGLELAADGVDRFMQPMTERLTKFSFSSPDGDWYIGCQQTIPELSYAVAVRGMMSPQWVFS